MSTERPATHYSAPAWSRARRLAFRFLALYLLLYCFPFPLDIFPRRSSFGDLYVEAWHAVIPWIGSTILGIAYEIPLGPSGSTDTTAEYVKLFSILVLATLGTLAWTLLDRRTSYPKLAAWLVVYARYWLGSIMISYGFAKLTLSQFSPPDASRLMVPYGESSPMALVWTFMGQSSVYQFFTGGVEAVGGVLLLWRRTTTLGALVCAGALTNVVMLNFCYDIPVKLFSSHLLLAAIGLASLDARRLAAVLLGRAAPAREVPPVLDGRRGRWIRRVGKGLFIAALCLVEGSFMTRPRPQREPPLYGLYEVTSHARDGVEQAALSGDPPTWRHVAFARRAGLTLWPVHGEAEHFEVEVDEQAGTLVVTARDPGSEPQTLRFHSPEDGMLVLEGPLEGTEQRITLRRVDEQAMRLPSRGFHWVNETPFYR